MGFTWEPARPRAIVICGKSLDLPEPTQGRSWIAHEDPRSDGLSSATADDAIINGIDAEQARRIRQRVVRAVASCEPDLDQVDQGMPAPSAVTRYDESAGVVVENGELPARGADQVPRSYVVVSTSTTSVHITAYAATDGAVSLLPAALALLRAQTS